MALLNMAIRMKMILKHPLRQVYLQEKAAIKDIKVTDKEVKEYYDKI